MDTPKTFNKMFLEVTNLKLILYVYFISNAGIAYFIR